MTTPLEIVGLDHVVLRVADLERSLRFYRDVLGCRIERRLETPVLVQLRAGLSLIDLTPARAGSAPSASFDHIAIQLAGFDEAAIRTYLATHRIEAAATKERYGARGFGPSIYINDPDGLTVELKGDRPASNPPSPQSSVIPQYQGRKV